MFNGSELINSTFNKSIDKIPDILEGIKNRIPVELSDKNKIGYGRSLLIGIGNGSIDLSQLKSVNSSFTQNVNDNSVRDFLQNTNEKIGEIYKGTKSSNPF